MTVFKGPRFRILHKPTGERIEVTAKNASAALMRLGWRPVDCMVLPLGRKIWLNEPKRYIKPTRDFYN